MKRIFWFVVIVAALAWIMEGRKAEAGAPANLDRGPSVAGIDANTNGVRDDLDAYLAEQYTSVPQRNAALQFARALQAAMLVDPADLNAPRKVGQQVSRAVTCVYAKFTGADDTKQAAAVIEELRSLSTNTKPRLRAYLAYNKALDGTTWTLARGDTCE